MSTIVCDGNVALCDSAACIGDMRASNTEEKMRVVDGYLFGVTGVAYALTPMIRWWMGGAKREDFAKIDGSFTFTVYFKDRVLVYNGEGPECDSRSYPTAFGSGTPFAMGALHAQSNAHGAIMAACALDLYSWGPVQTFAVPDKLSTDPHPVEILKTVKRRLRGRRRR